MIETKVRIDEKVQEDLNQKPKMISIIFMLVGTLGLIAYIILSVVLDPVPLWVEFFLMFAAFLGIGVVQYFVVKQTNKNSMKDENQTELSIVFNDDHYIASSFKNGEEIGRQKVMYSDVTIVRETTDYFFIKPSRAIQAFHTVDKKAVSAEDFAQIKAYFKHAKKR